MAIQNTFYLDVDIKRDNYVDEPKVTQNDAVTFVLRLTDDGIEYALDGVSTYTLASLRPDGQSVLTVGTLTAPNEITFDLGTTEVSVPGNVKAAIQLYDADGRVSSIPFTYEVSKDIAVDYVPSVEEQTLIQLVLGEGPAILAAAQTATTEANAAATNADAKAQLADVSATNANDKATLANDAATAATNATADVQTAITEAESATLAATTAAGEAQTATNDAIDATTAINLVLPNVEGLEYVEPYNATTQYEKNNIVRNGKNSYIALQSTLGNAPTGTNDSPFWGVLAVGGIDGTGSVVTVNGVSPDANGNVQITVASDWLTLTGKPTEFPPSAHTHTIADVDGLQEHIESHVAHTYYAVATGPANAYEANISTGVNAYEEGASFRIKVNVTNTGASTVDINSLGPIPILKSDGTDVKSGDLVAGSIYTLAYNGTSFILQGEGGGGDSVSDEIMESLRASALSLINM